RRRSRRRMKNKNRTPACRPSALAWGRTGSSRGSVWIERSATRSAFCWWGKFGTCLCRPVAGPTVREGARHAPGDCTPSLTVGPATNEWQVTNLPHSERPVEWVYCKRSEAFCAGGKIARSGFRRLGGEHGGHAAAFHRRRLLHLRAIGQLLQD